MPLSFELLISSIVISVCNRPYCQVLSIMRSSKEFGIIGVYAELRGQCVRNIVTPFGMCHSLGQRKEMNIDREISHRNAVHSTR